MGCPVRLSFLLCAVSASLSAAAWVVPRAAEITSAGGAHYTTDLKILNRGADTAGVQLQFIPSGGKTAPAAVTQSIAAGQTLVLAGVLNSVWNLSETFGGIQITSDHVLLVAARTYNNANPPGAYGYQEEAALLTDLPDGGQQRHAIWVSQSADPTQGFTTIAGAVLLTPDAAVTATLFDPSGASIGSTAITGGVGAHEVALSTLAKSKLPIGRLEFNVTSGQAAPYAMVIDNVTADIMSVPAAPLTTAATDVVFPNLAKADASQTGTWRSDLRMISTAAAPVAVQVTVVSSSAPALTGTTQSITLNPGRVTEIQDVLGSLFSAPDGATATLELQCPSAVPMLARTAYVNTDGTPGSFGYLQPAQPVAAYLVPGAAATLIGLKQDTSAPGAVSTIGVAAGADGFTADITLSDASGNVLATIPSGLSALPLATAETPLAALFPSVTIPDDARLDIAPDSGEAVVYAKNADVATNDINLAAASTPQPYYCPAPSVVSFSALPATLAAAGSVRLNWYATGAASVQIDQGVGNAGESGSATVSLKASTTFHLTAQNGCGTATAALSVPIGLPTLSAITPASPMPGQTAALSLGNYSDLGTVLGATLSCGTSTVTQSVALNADASGKVTFIVPFVQDAAFPAGYWNGSCTLAALTDNGQSAPLKFTIAPLTFTGDPVAAFKTLVANLQQQAHAAFAEQAGVDPFQDTAAALDPIIDQWAAQLNQMASDIGSSGTATVPLDVPTASQPKPPTFTITRAQLTALVAFLNATAPDAFVPALLRLHPRAVPGSYHDDGSGNCLIRDSKIGSVYGECLSMAGSRPLDVPLSVLMTTAVSQSCAVNPNIPYLAAKLLQMLASPQYVCGVMPVTWKAFSARQAGNQANIPLGPANLSGNLGTQITASLGKGFSVMQQSTAGHDLANVLVTAMIQVAKENGCSNAVLFELGGLFTPLTAAVSDAAGQYLAKVSAQYPDAYSTPVYKCDLSSVMPFNPGELRPRPDLESPNVPLYYFDGLQVGAALLQVQGYPGNFIWPNAFGFYNSPRPGSFPTSRPLVNVDNRPKLQVINQSAYTYDANDPGSIPTPPLTQVFPPLPVVSQYSTWSGGFFAPASAVAVVTPAGNNTWTLMVQAKSYHKDDPQPNGAQIEAHASMGVQAINPAPFGQKSHIKVDAQMTTTPVCNQFKNCSFPVGSIMVIDANGQSTFVELNSGSNPFPLTVDSSNSAATPVFITAGLENTPQQGLGTTSFSVTLTIQFLDQ